MPNDKRQNYRCNVSREIAQAELVVDQCARKVQLVNESVGGYLALLKGKKSDFKVDSIALLKTAGGWYNVKIIRRSVTEDGEMIGLLRLGVYQPPPKPSDCVNVWRSAIGAAFARNAHSSAKGGNLLVWMGLGSVAMLALAFVIYIARPSLFRPAHAKTASGVPLDLADATAAVGELGKAADAAPGAAAGVAASNTKSAAAAAVKRNVENFAAGTVAPALGKAVDSAVTGAGKVADEVAELAAAPNFDARNFGPLRRLDLLTSANFIKRLQLTEGQAQRISQIQTHSLREIEQLRKEAGLAQDQFNKQALALAEQAEQSAHRVLSADQREKFINFNGPPAN